MARRGRPKHPDILTPREWEVLTHLREGLTNRQIGERLGISLAGARYHVSEILGKLGLSSRREAAVWQVSRVPWWRAAALGFLAWPFKKLLWGSAVKAAAAAAVVATVGLFAVPDGFGLLVTDPEIGPVPALLQLLLRDGQRPLPPHRQPRQGRRWRLVSRLFSYRFCQ